MKSYSICFSILIVGLLSVTSSCKKDKSNDAPNNIVEKKGLVVSGDQEVPVKTTSAAGTLDVSYNKDTHLLSFTVNYSNLTGVPTGAHIHGTALRGVNTGIKYDFFDKFPQTASGTFTNSVTVDNTTTAINEDSLLAGYYYLNIHTAVNPAGEIRGQIEF